MAGVSHEVGLLFCRKLSCLATSRIFRRLLSLCPWKVCVCGFFSFLKVYAELLRASIMTEKVTDITAGRQVMFNIYHGSLWQHVNVFNRIQQKVNCEWYISPTLSGQKFVWSAQITQNVRVWVARGGLLTLLSGSYDTAVIIMKVGLVHS